MKLRSRFIPVVISLLLLATTTATTLAQSGGGTIMGSVFNDQDANGQCVGTGERGLPGVVVRFANSQAALQTALETDQDGMFGYTSAGFGTWIVSVEPPDGWYVSSQDSHQVALTSTQPVITGVNFCVAQGTDPDSEVTTSSPVRPPVSSKSVTSSSAVTLPESGAPIAPALLVAASAGFALLVVGLSLYFYSRRSSI